MLGLNKKDYHSGFTIVEMIVVISVIAILTVIGVVSYGSWRNSTLQSQVKSDLVAGAAAMEKERNFGDGYSANLPVDFQSSTGVTLSGGSTDGGKTFCLDGVSTSNGSIQFYIDSENKSRGAVSGMCSDRVFTTPPPAPTGLAVGSVTSTSLAIGWTGSTGALSHVVQCASDPGFIYGLKQVNVAVPTVTASVTGLTPSSTFYCRVKATNNAGASSWSATTSTATSGTYVAFAVGTSIGGYWTTAPQGFLLENGAAVSRAVYADLFAVIGTTYGAGDGSTTFNLPDSRGRATASMNNSEAEFAVMGYKYGTKTETITTTTLPAHHHGIRTEAGFNANLNSAAPGGQYNQLTTNAGYPMTGYYTQADGGGGGQSHDNIQPSIVTTSAIKYSLPVAATESSPVGTTIEGYWNTAPSGYLLEDGAAVSRTTYADLFASVGTTYGAGNGSTTFNLPDSRGRVQVNRNSADTEFDTIGEKYGSKTVTLTAAQIPAHQHNIRAEYGYSGVNVGIPGQYNQLTNHGGYAFRYEFTQVDGGSGQPHNEIQPSIVKKYAIKHIAPVADSTPIATGGTLKGYWGTIPAGYLAEDGSAVSRTTYADLFAVINTTHGAGDGSTTFNLPDSRGRVTVNRRTVDTEFDTIGEKYGSKTVTLTLAQIPVHQHAIRAEYGSTTVNTGVPARYNQLTTNGAYPFRGDYTQADGGSGQSHNNIQPSIVVMSAIKF